jgi:hypothetical protein
MTQLFASLKYLPEFRSLFFIGSALVITSLVLRGVLAVVGRVRRSESKFHPQVKPNLAE